LIGLVCPRPGTIPWRRADVQPRQPAVQVHIPLGSVARGPLIVHTRIPAHGQGRRSRDFRVNHHRGRVARWRCKAGHLDKRLDARKAHWLRLLSPGIRRRKRHSVGREL
jgi:hypothetical protein